LVIGIYLEFVIWLLEFVSVGNTTCVH